MNEAAISDFPGMPGEVTPACAPDDYDRFLDELADELSDTWTATPTPRQQPFRAYVRQELPRELAWYASSQPGPAVYALRHMRTTHWFLLTRFALKRGFLRQTRPGNLIAAHIVPVVVYPPLFWAISQYVSAINVPWAGSMIVSTVALQVILPAIAGAIAGLASPRFALAGTFRSLALALVPIAFYMGLQGSGFKIPFHFAYVAVIEKILDILAIYTCGFILVVLPTTVCAAVAVELRDEVLARR